MDMGYLIAERRKAKGMTQKQLANKLDVTDKAVSKWERGNGYPDIRYLEALAKSLDITLSDLLKSSPREEHALSPDSALFEQTSVTPQGAGNEQDNNETIVNNSLEYANSVYQARGKNILRVALFSFIALGLAGIITTSIVNFAINGRLTWSLLPISAIVFSWLCTAPMLFFKKHCADVALLFTSVFLLPFLFVINKIIGGDWFVSVATPMALSGIVILWLIRAVFTTKLTIWSKLATCAIIAGAGNIVIAFMLGQILGEAGFGIWNLIATAILLVTALLLFVVGRARNKVQK